MRRTEINGDTLVMRTPAAWHRDMYREAAPTGNGLIGALVYGGISQERIAINHARLWEQGKRQELPDIHETLALTRDAIDRGEYLEGNWYSANALKEQGYAPRLGNPVPVGDLALEMDGRDIFRHYRRLVHMDTGEIEVTWQEGEQAFWRRAFVSRKRDMVFVCAGTDGRPFTLLAGAGRHETWEDDAKKKWESQEPSSFAQGNCFGFQAVHEDGTWYGLLCALDTDGRVSQRKGSLFVEGATRVTVAVKPVAFSEGELKPMLQAAGDGQGAREELPGERQGFWGELSWAGGLSREELFDYEARLREHVALHEPLYRSAELSLSHKKDTPNEELLARAFEEEASPELLEKQWKLGRYLMVSGTREDGNPFPLYGLWHGRYKMNWPHNMANENVEMIYWHTLPGNLGYTMRTLIDYYVKRMPAFRECARKLFGLPGIYLPAGTTPEHCYPTQIVPVILNWIGCAGWLSQMFYRYYQYTGDRELLESRILPFMYEAGLFYENYIVRDEKGTVRIYPSVSPENTPGNLIPPENPDMAHPCPSVENATMDIAIMKELFTNLLEVSGETGLYQEKRRLWEDIIAHLPAYGTTEDGDVREWQKDGLEERYNHRHLSHIYPLFPGTEIVRGRDDEAQVRAFEKAVDKRILGAQTGWSLSHMACIYARLQRPERVMECLDTMDKACLLKNLFTLHNDWRGMGLTLGRGSSAPVQLDAAMGVVQALQECLLFVDRDCVKLLPALPERLGQGALKNFRFMAGMVCMDWSLGERKLRAVLSVERQTEITVILPSWAEGVRVRQSGVTGGAQGAAPRSLCADGCSVKLKLQAGETVEIENI